MTNSEKYLKDEKYIFDIAKGIAEAICYDDMEHAKKITEKEIRNWFTSNIKPTLTEDERIVLRSIDEHSFKDIRRNQYGFLELYDECLNEWISCQFKDDLFQFIKNGEEYEIAELLKGE